ncbi:hypothetical protein [Arthrobacter sp. MW3 TE3886]|uniref:hypothetical protein n=1 Tax=Arthrobacter sp. MW3 TE3886 TaxID=3156254 RepID=UPI003517A5C9
MAAAFVDHAATALRRGFLLVGLLAIVAGFLGMHIMTGMHGAHATTAVTSSAEAAGPSSRPETNLASHPAAHAPHAGTTAHDSMAPAASATAGPEPSGNTKAAAPSASCVCQSSCTDPASMHSACVPSAAVTSLAAPPPGMAPDSLHNPDTPGDAAAVRAYSYLPASPSPGDLSISRT